MKEVTKERILQALENIERYYHSQPETHIVHTLMTVGLNSGMCKAGTQRDPFTDRDRLELAYQGFSDPAEIFKRLSRWGTDQNLDTATAIKQAWISAFKHINQKASQRNERILALAQKHRISGLEKKEVNFEDKKHSFHTPTKN